MIRLTSMLSLGWNLCIWEKHGRCVHQFVCSQIPESKERVSWKVLFRFSSQFLLIPLTCCVMGFPSIWEENGFHLPGRSRCDLEKSSLRPWGLAAVGFSDVRIVRMILPLCLAESRRHGASRILVRVTLGLWGEGSAAPGRGTPYFPHHCTGLWRPQAADKWLNHFLRASGLLRQLALTLVRRSWLTGDLSLAEPWKPISVYPNSSCSLLIYCPRWPVVDPFFLFVGSQGTPETSLW